MKVCIFFTLLYSMLCLAQPVAVSTVLGPDDMELKLIKEEERNGSQVSIQEIGPSTDKEITKTSMASPHSDGSPAQPTVTTINPAVALQFDNLPKIVTEVSNTLEGGFDMKISGIRQNEELCGQKLQEIKQVVESQLKRSVYRAECSEPEFARTGTNRIQFASKATVTFY